MVGYIALASTPDQWKVALNICKLFTKNCLYSIDITTSIMSIDAWHETSEQLLV